MGQIVGGSAKPKRCNLNKLSQLGTPAAGEHILVSSDNSMNAAGQGYFDSYVVGDGHTAATELPLQKFKAEELDEQINGVDDEVITVSVPATAGTAIGYGTKHDCRLEAGKTYTLVYTGTVKNIAIYFRDSADAAADVYLVGPGTAHNTISLTPAAPTRTIIPSTDIYYVHFYATAANVVNTETIQFEFSWHSDYVPLTSKVQMLETEMEQSKSSLANKVDVLVGKNLFNKNNIKTGLYIASNGATPADNTCAISALIEIEGNTNYHLSNKDNGKVGNGKYINFYNSSGEVISTIADATQFTSPASAKYILFSIVDYSTTLDDDIQLEKGTTRTSFLEYNEIGGYLSEYESKGELEIDLKEKVSIKLGKNLYDASTKTEGKYFNTSGIINSNASYNISDFIPVEASTTYCVSDSTDQYVGSAAACHVLYDANKEKLSVVTGDNKTLTTTATTKYIRISMLAAKTEIQVEKGSTRTSYQVFSQIGGYPSIVTDNSVGFSALKADVIAAINSVTPISFNSLRGSATLVQNGMLYLAQNHVMKNSLLSAKIKGTISQISVGVGYSTNVNFDFRSYQSHWVTLTATEVKLYNYYNNGWVLAQTYSHGLTLTNNTLIEVDSSIEASQVTMLRIYDDLGNVFQQALPSWGMGRAFVTNDGSASVDVQLSFFPRDITHNVWLFGDSYMSFGSNARWPYYATQAGFINWLCNAQPGLSPDAAYTDLENMVALGYRPSYLVWCLGMNGATTETQVDGQYVINSAQKAVIDDVVTLCANYNITPVFGTVPTVPERQKTGFSNYIRTLGKRYIDFAEAVGANSSGIWNTGLLSSDNVHPTAAGAKVLFSQVLVDFPEIVIVE